MGQPVPSLCPDGKRSHQKTAPDGQMAICPQYSSLFASKDDVHREQEINRVPPVYMHQQQRVDHRSLVKQMNLLAIIGQSTDRNVECP